MKNVVVLIQVMIASVLTVSVIILMEEGQEKSGIIVMLMTMFVFLSAGITFFFLKDEYEKPKHP